jgi:hypothetical protein
MGEVRKYVIGNDGEGNQLFATDDRDIQPLVEAAREAEQYMRWRRKGKPLSAKHARLIAALKPFDSKEDATQGIHQLQANEETGQ